LRQLGGIGETGNVEEIRLSACGCRRNTVLIYRERESLYIVSKSLGRNHWTEKQSLHSTQYYYLLYLV